MDVNFCCYCGAMSNKILTFSDKSYCKSCDRFFQLKTDKVKCPKCFKGNMKISDFPMPDGAVVFHCNSCKRMCSLEEISRKE